MAATATTSRQPTEELDQLTPAAPAGARPDTGRPGILLLAALGLALAYAAFAHGAASYPGEARLQVGLALIALAATAALLWHGRLRLAASPAAWAGLGLLGAFAAWSGLSLVWSVAPSGTWIELNRAIAYVLVVALAIAAGSWHRRAVWYGALGYAGLALVVAVYALGGKVAPDVFQHTDDFSRLRAPLQYWNALALFLVMGVPIVLRLAVDETRAARVRLAALAALPVLLVGIGLTYSRGGLLALVVAVGVTLAGAGARLRSLMYLGIAIAAAVPALVLGFSADDLTRDGVEVAARRGEGLLLGALLVAGMAAAVVVGRLVLSAEARTAPDAARSRLIGRGLAGLLAVALLAGVVAMAVSDRGLTGTISHEWDTFTSARGSAQQDDPGRLLSTNAGNRWVWWSEALGAWSDHPIAGSGAGSFPVRHRQYRENQLDVLQPHSMPLQFLAETGLLGFVLVTSGLLLLFAGAAGALRLLAPGPERGLAAALLAAAAAWFVHGTYDWDWDLPGVTLPALAFLGLLCARGAVACGRGWSPAGVGGGARAVVMAAATVVLATVALSAALPSWADSKTTAALDSVRRDSSPGALREAQSDADFASRLDPLSVEPLFAAATLAERRGRTLEAREYLLDAVGRQPESLRAWVEIVRFEADRGDYRNVRAGLARMLDLDPRNRAAAILLARIEFLSFPPSDSVTATGTPLVAVVGQTPPP